MKRFSLVVVAALFCVAGCSSNSQPVDNGTPVGDVLAGDVAADAADAVDAGDVTVAGDAADARGDDLPLVDGGNGCAVCTYNSECVSGQSCMLLGAEKHCLSECSDDGDCGKGFVCYGVSGGMPRYCVPESYSCVACIFDTPCGDGMCCDLNTGLCKDCGGECSACSYDYDCGDGLRCFKQDGAQSGMCVPECVDGACADADTYNCVSNLSGVEMCQPITNGCGGCSGATPWPFDGGCVGCRDRNDCEVGAACLLHECTLLDCDIETEMACDDGDCHECCGDSDCTGQSGRTGVCLEDGTCQVVPHCGGLCTMDFPSCTVVEGVEMCVQCLDDVDCGVLGATGCTCTGAPLFTCVDDGGEACIEEHPQCFSACDDAADCPAGLNDTVMECVDVEGYDSNMCIDPAGRCDGVTACCAPGNACFDLADILHEIWGSAIPVSRVPASRGAGASRLIPTPEGYMAYCGCTTAADCLAGDPCTETAFICDQTESPLGEFYDLLCPQGQLDGRFPAKLCIQPSVLREMFGITAAQAPVR